MSQNIASPGSLSTTKRGKRSATWPQIVVSTTETTGPVSRAVARGELRKLASRLYTANQVADPAALIRRHLAEVAAGFFPGAVIGDRSALVPGFVAEGAPLR